MDADLVLLEQWRAGDKAAGEELFQRHFADVLRFFENKVWNRAEDLTQQTFLACVAAQVRFRGDSAFRTYLFAIAWNQLRHYLRGLRQDQHIDFDVSSLSELAESMTSPSSKLDRVRRDRQIQEALALLPLAQQTLLELHYWQGLDAPSLSEILGVPAGAIRVRLLRARNALRDKIEGLSNARARSEDAEDPLTTSLKRLEVEDRRSEAEST